MMKVYRTARKQFINDLSGMGAWLYGGRWNSKGVSMLYTSEHPSLALLELICNSSTLSATKDIGLAELTLPTGIELKTMSRDDLPFEWWKYPAPLQLRFIGDKWIKENKTLALKVPSAVLPMEYNVLINPAHRQFERIELKLMNDFIFDERLITH